MFILPWIALQKFELTANKKNCVKDVRKSVRHRLGKRIYKGIDLFKNDAPLIDERRNDTPLMDETKNDDPYQNCNPGHADT